MQLISGFSLANLKGDVYGGITAVEAAARTGTQNA
jgi:hypothetical protein